MYTRSNTTGWRSERQTNGHGLRVLCHIIKIFYSGEFDPGSG